jgi:hypothetical protein
MTAGTRILSWTALALVGCASAGATRTADSPEATPVVQVAEPQSPSNAAGANDGLDAGGSVGGTAAGVCPKAPPKAGQACSLRPASEGQNPFCEYGDEHRLECRSRFHCDNGRWGAPLAPVDPACKVPIPACEESVSDGSACSDDQASNVCIREQATCGCRLCHAPGGPAWVWRCADPPSPPCPANVPSLGGPCQQADQVTCKYGINGTSTYWVMTCVAGQWDGNRGNPDVCSVE